MSQFGMQMPGVKTRRSASMTVYTGLLFGAVIALGTACVFMYLAAQKVSPDAGNPFALQEAGKVTLPSLSANGARR